MVCTIQNAKFADGKYYCFTHMTQNMNIHSYYSYDTKYENKLNLDGLL